MRWEACLGAVTGCGEGGLRLPAPHGWLVHEAALGVEVQEHKEQERADPRVINAAGIPVAARGPLLIYLVLNKDGSLTSCKRLKAYKDPLAVLYRIHVGEYRKPRRERRKHIHPHPLHHAHAPLSKNSASDCRAPAALRSVPFRSLLSPPAAGGPKGRELLRGRAGCRGHPSAKSLAIRAGPKLLVSGPCGIAAVVPGSADRQRRAQGRFTDPGRLAQLVRGSAPEQ